MGDLNMSLKEALTAAIEMEKRGYEFFSDTAQKADEELAKEVFTFLAAEELNHIKAIEKFSQESLSGENTSADEVIAEMKDNRPRQTINELFKNLSGTVPLEGTNLDAYKFAMDFERKGGEFYKKAEAEAADPGAKKLFGFLVGEERKHFKIVESCLLYFDNPEEFFHQRESWHMEG
ncbi:MAG: ferritin family protein [Candidatus Zixiibacteriota bacterium]|nr:MAG: ferritin family protein [candidate division Zixibacteria bacterium]